MCCWLHGGTNDTGQSRPRCRVSADAHRSRKQTTPLIEPATRCARCCVTPPARVRQCIESEANLRGSRTNTPTHRCQPNPRAPAILLGPARHSRYAVSLQVLPTTSLCPSTPSTQRIHLGRYCLQAQVATPLCSVGGAATCPDKQTQRQCAHS